MCYVVIHSSVSKKTEHSMLLITDKFELQLKQVMNYHTSFMKYFYIEKTSIKFTHISSKSV